MAKWAYEFQVAPRQPVERGELDARGEEEARRKLRVLLAAPRLPPGTRLIDLSAEKEAAASQRSAKLRRLLRVIAAHHAWLKGEPDGARADLGRQKLAGLNLHDADLSNAEMARPISPAATCSARTCGVPPCPAPTCRTRTWPRRT